MNFNIKILFFTFCIFIQISVVAQIPKIETIDIEDGLFNNTVKAIFQDSYGFMWFGTKDGLVRYDGIIYDEFLEDKRDTTQLLDGYITALFQATDNNVYIGTFGGTFSRFNYSTGQIERLFSLDEISDLKMGYTISKIIEFDNFLYISTLGGGVLKCDFSFSNIDTLFLSDNNGDKIKTVSDISTDNDNNIWIVSECGLLSKFDGIKTESFSLPNFTKSPYVSFGSKLLINENKIYVGTEQLGVYIFDISNNRFSHLECSKKYHITDIVKADNKIIFSTDGNGVVIYDILYNTHQQYLASSEDVFSISTNGIWSLFYSSDNILWIGTFARGINHLSIDKQQFSNYRYVGGSEYSVSAPSVLGVEQTSDGYIWFATDGGGVDRFDIINRVFKNYNIDNSLLKSNVVKSVYQDNDGLIWFGTYANGISFLSQNAYIEHGELVEKLNSISVWDIIQDSDGVYWFATLYQGLYSYDAKSKIIKNYKSDSRNKYSLASNVIYVLYLDDDSNIWIGTDGGGVSRYDKTNDIFINYCFEIERKSSIGSNDIRAIFQDTKGRMWFGTKNGGLNLLIDDTKKEFEQFTQNNGLSSNTIHGILEDSLANLWLSSEKGIMKFCTNTNNVVTYSTANGLHGNYFNYQSSTKTQNGQLIWGGLDGFTVLNNNKVVTKEPILLLRDVYIDGNPIYKTNPSIPKNSNKIFELDKILLNSDYSIFSIDFAFFNYNNKSKYTIKYKIDGLNNEWVELAHNKKSLELNKIKGGKYSLRFLVTNSEGIESKEQVLDFYIKRSIWEQPIFYLIIVFVLLVLIFFIFMSVIKIKNKRAKFLEDKIEERTSYIKSQNVLLLNQRDSLKNSNDEILKQKKMIEDSFEELNVQNEELRAKSELLKEVNDEITNQNIEIAEQSKKIEEKNNLITKSINYAKRIQNTIFPSQEQFRTYLPNSFVFFRPKDIVSGDFFWTRQVKEYTIIAEVDCTGHGVPGAFMSMIGNTLLTEIVLNKQILFPDKILYELNKELLEIFSLGQFDVEAQDEGMDLTIGLYDSKSKRLYVSSAMQNFYLMFNNDLSAYRGDIFSVGGLMARYKKPEYTLHEFDIQDGMRFYFSSDGFIDQFGGEERSKFGVDRFENLLMSKKNIPITKQEIEFENNLKTWIGKNDQLDDILVVGFEF